MWALLSVSAVLLVAFALRVFQLGSHEFWFDEAASAFIATKSLTDIISYIQGQLFEHPPFYYFLLHGWIQLAGRSEFALRYFSVWFGVLLVALVWLLVKPYNNRTVGVSCAFIAALMPFQIVQAQQARMYTLLACLGALSMITLWRAMKYGGSRWWLAYGAVTAVGMGTHYYSVILPLGQSAFILIHYRKSLRELKAWILTMLVLAAPPSLWLLASAGPRNAITQSFQNWSLSQANSGDLARLAAESVVGSLSPTEITPADWLGTLAVLALAAIGLWFGQRGLTNRRILDTSEVRPLHNLIGFSLVVPVLISLLLPHNLIARYLSTLDAAFYAAIGIGIGVVGYRSRLIAGGATVLVGAVCLYGVHTYFASVSAGEFREATEIIQDSILPGDAIVLTNPDEWPIQQYYMPSDWQVYYVPGAPRPPTDAEVATALKSIVSGHNRIWLGPTNAATRDPQGKVESWLLQNAYRASKQWLPGSTSVSLFFRANSGLEQHPSQYRLDPYVYLRGYAISSDKASPSDGVRIHLTWEPMSRFDFKLLVGLRLVDQAGLVLYDSTDVFAANSQPAKDGQQIGTNYALLIPPETPPGKYRIDLSVSSADSEKSLSFQEVSTGKSPGAALTLGEVEVVRSDESPLPSAKSTPSKQVFGDEIELVRAEAKPGSYIQGDEIDVGLYWRALTAPSQNYDLVFQMIDGRGQQADEQVLPMMSEDYPPTRWRPSEYLKGMYEVRVPTSLPDGRYELRVALQNPATGALLNMHEERWQEILWGLLKQYKSVDRDSATILSFSAVERPRDFNRPTVEQPRDDDFDGRIRLVGYGKLPSSVKPGQNLPLTLYWQAIREMGTSYTVFVHLLNDKGQVVAQQDIAPRGGTYETDTWAAGEFVSDEHQIALPANLPEGTYTIEIGLYDSKTMARLPVLGPSGQAVDERIVLPSLGVTP